MTLNSCQQILKYGTKAQATKREKTDKLDLIKFKTFVCQGHYQECEKSRRNYYKLSVTV